MDILISDPLIKKEIIRVEMIDNDNAEVIFKDGSQTEVFIRDKVDDPNFDLDLHVERMRLPEPSNWKTLRDVTVS